ncbi:hypothetical protein [Arthrobacter sp. 31Y]|uniref:hypothetical protein n=1 Tax=Arthrobacter sp. 31Y TaxID=1115632 RepID=UPI0004676DAF|nr:hypothetical protein [Arthrobacter sp. 31Y]
MEASEFESHPLWEKPVRMQAVLDEFEGTFENPAPVAFARLRWIAVQLEKFRTMDPGFFVPDQLRMADDVWQNVLNYLENYRGNPTGGYESSAVSYAESWLQTAGGWHRPQASSNALARQAKQEYESLVSSYQSVNQSLLALLEEERVAARENASALENQVSGLEMQVSAAQQSLVDLETTIRADKRILEDAVTGHDEIFRSAQTERNTEFTNWLKTQRENFGELAKPHVEALKSTALEGSEILKRIRSLGDQTDVAAGQTTGHILAEEFKKSSDAERKSGNVSFWAGVVVALIGVGWLIYVAIATFDVRGEFNWNWIALKISLTLALGGVATVLIRRGQHSQATARDYKRTELELRAIGPFLSDIKTTTIAEEAKVDFLKRTFGRSSDGSGAGAGDDAGQVLGSKALDILGNFADKIPTVKS